MEIPRIPQSALSFPDMVLIGIAALVIVLVGSYLLAKTVPLPQEKEKEEKPDKKPITDYQQLTLIGDAKKAIEEMDKEELEGFLRVQRIKQQRKIKLQSINQ